MSRLRTEPREPKKSCPALLKYGGYCGLHKRLTMQPPPVRVPETIDEMEWEAGQPQELQRQQALIQAEIRRRQELASLPAPVPVEDYDPDSFFA
jgi:hypothetical protein